MREITEVIKVFDVDPFQTGDGDAFHFRLEVSRPIDGKTFVGRVYRLEFYRLQPTFPQTEGEPLDWKDDARIFVVDEMFDPDLLKGDSVQEVLNKFQMALAKIFG
jgi:hypothetical protein